MIRYAFALVVVMTLAGCRESLDPSPTAVRAPEFSHSSGATWGTIADMVSVRYSHAAAAGPDGRVYAFGGQITGAPVTDAEVYDPVADLWSAIAPLPGVARMYAGAASGSDGRIYVAGGSDGNSTHSSVVAYDPAFGSFSTVPSMSVPRTAAGVTAGLDGRIYVTGGAGQGIHISSEVYNPATNAWTSIAPMSLSRYAHAAATGADGRIYVFGGLNLDLWATIALSEVFDPATNTWTPIADMPQPRHNHVAVTGSDGHIYIMGGQTPGPPPSGYELPPDVFAYDPVSNTWTTIAPLSTGRYAPAGAAVADRIYVFGGQSPLGDVLRTGESYATAVSPLEVGIDIKPGGTPNSINRKSNGKIPVALFGSSAFVATSAIRSTIEFAGAPALGIGGSAQDVNGDGHLDIVFHFSTPALNLPNGTTEACLTGRTTTDQPFKGCDAVTIVK